MLVGADYNMQPQTLVGTGLLAELGADVVAAANPRGTCRTRTAARNYDYFLAGGQVKGIIESVRTIEGSGNKTHTPVQLALQPQATALKALHLRSPPRLPTERVFGPLPPPPEWQAAQPLFEEAVEAARSQPRGKAEQALSAAYALWAHMAEHELGDVTGQHVAKPGTRSTRPNLVWRSVLPERRPLEEYPSASALSWIKDLGRELARAATSERKLAEAARAVREALATDIPHGTPCDKVIGAANGLLDITDFIINGGNGIGDDDGTMMVVDSMGAPRDVMGEMSKRIGDFIDDAGANLKLQEDIDGREGKAKWRAWLREDAGKGASHAHAYSRIPDEW